MSASKSGTEERPKATAKEMAIIDFLETYSPVHTYRPIRPGSEFKGSLAVQVAGAVKAHFSKHPQFKCGGTVVDMTGTTVSQIAGCLVAK